MNWTHILYLPALASVIWPVLIVFIKKNPTRAQLLLALTLVFEAAAMLVLGVYFRGRAGCLFIYDFLFESIAIICGPMYYLGICSLTGPTGVTLRQRYSMLLPMLFILGLTIGAWILGPRRYELMCEAIRNGVHHWEDSNPAMIFMLFLHSFLFPVLLVIYNFVLLLMAGSKLKRYRERYNSFYSSRTGTKIKDNRFLDVFMWLFLPLGLVTVVLVENRPAFVEYYLVTLSVAIAVEQVLYGHYVFNLDHDARYLAELVRKNPDEK